MNTDGDNNFARREMRGGRPDSGTVTTIYKVLSKLT